LKPWSEFVTIGRVVKPQGRKGELAVEPLSDREGRFATLRRAFVASSDGRPREVAVTGCFAHKGRYVLKLQGVDSIDAAEALRDTDLRISPDDLAALPPGSYYHHDLVGLAVEDARGRAVGAVGALWETGAGAPVLVIEGPGGETLLPFAPPFLREVDLAAKRLVVEMPEVVDGAH
jgi:16S rRNA processing protein RimM